MSDNKAYAATPKATLEMHIMDSRIPKSEAEHWARREIERLREALERISRYDMDWTCDGAANVERLQGSADAALNTSKVGGSDGWRDRATLLAALDASRERERALREALEDIARGDYSDPMCTLTPEGRARAALTATEKETDNG